MEPIPQTKFVFPAAAQLGCGRRLHRMRQVGVSINHPLAPMPTAHCQLSDYHTSTNSTQKKKPTISTYTSHTLYHLQSHRILPPSPTTSAKRMAHPMQTCRCSSSSKQQSNVLSYCSPTLINFSLSSPSNCIFILRSSQLIMEMANILRIVYTHPNKTPFLQ